MGPLELLHLNMYLNFGSDSHALNLCIWKFPHPGHHRDTRGTPQEHCAFASTWYPMGWAPKGVISLPLPLLHFHVYLISQAGNTSSSVHFTITNLKYYFKCVRCVLICQIFMFCGERWTVEGTPWRWKLPPDSAISSAAGPEEGAEDSHPNPGWLRRHHRCCAESVSLRSLTDQYDYHHGVHQLLPWPELLVIEWIN